MDKLYKNSSGKMCLCNGDTPATHVLMTIKEYDSLETTIQNLKRINKERSNKERGLEPKKQRSGYILLGYDTNDFKLKFAKENTSYECRRLLLETPYTVSLSYKKAYDLILEDLLKLCGEFNADSVIEKTAILTVEMADSYFSMESAKVFFMTSLEAQRNGIWAVRLYANFTPNVPVDCIKEMQSTTKRGE